MLVRRPHARLRSQAGATNAGADPESRSDTRVDVGGTER